MEFNKGTVLLYINNAFNWYFWVKFIVRRVLEARKIWTLCRSLLLSTTVLNDKFLGSH